MDSFHEGLQPSLIQDKLFLNCLSHLEFNAGWFVATNGLQRKELIEFCLPRSSGSWAVEGCGGVNGGGNKNLR